MSTSRVQTQSNSNDVINNNVICEMKDEEIEDESFKSRNWFITCNNWTQETHNKLLNLKNCKYMFQHEVGKEGTPHINGVLMFVNQRKWKSLRNTIGEYWYKPALNVNACINYCSKVATRVSETYFTNIDKYIKEDLEDWYEDELAKPWQKEILNIIETKPDRRKIHWYWSNKGEIGKTTMVRHILIKHADKATYVAGEYKNIMFAVCALKKFPKIIMWNLPRSVKNISYRAVESIKDGILFNEKYESGCKVVNPPHIIIFANWRPCEDDIEDEEYLSKDRWIITNVDDCN